MTRSDIRSDWDPTTISGEPHDAYRRMREECPVAYSEQYGGFWSLFRYRDIVAAARNSDVFSSADTRIGSIPAFEMPSRRVPIQSDPPEHTYYRSLLQQFVEQERLSTFRPHVEELARDMIADLLETPDTDVELVEQLATPFAVRTLCRFAGVPEGAWPELSQITGRIMKHARDQESAELSAANAEMDCFIDDIVRSRQVKPVQQDHSVVSGLIRYEADGRPLPLEVITALVRQLLVAGHDSTGRAIGIVLNYLANAPDLQELVRSGQGPLPRVIAEILRLDSPVQHLSRLVTEDIDIEGRRLRKGDLVALMWISGNHDERRYEDPEHFDLERKPPTSLTFGHGLHMCLGAPLARMELEIVVEELCRQTTNFSASGPATRCSWPRNGFTSVPVRLARTPIAE